MILSLRQLLASPDNAYAAGHILAHDDKKPVTWSQFCARIGAWQAVLISVNQPWVALYQRDGLEFLAALLAVWRLGKQVLLPANNLPATIAQLQQHTRCFAGEFPGIDSINPAAESAPLIDLATTIHPELALMLFTSGSSGAPEPVTKSFAQLEAELELLEQFRGEQLAGACITGSVSHQHIYGLLFRLLWPLASGRPFISRERNYWEELAADVNQHPRVAIVTSPAHLNRISPITFTTSPCTIFSSGAPLSADAAQAASGQLECAVTEVYGSTETGGIAWREQTKSADWQCLPGVSVGVAQATGLLQVKSVHLPGVDWFITADIARITDVGFSLQGRADRIAKIAGKRISLTAVEQLIQAHPLVHEVRVVALPERGDRLGAVVVLTADGCTFLQNHGKKLLNEQLKQGLDQALERIAIPRYWRYARALPQNSQGKVTLTALQALFTDAAAPILPTIIARTGQGAALQLTLDIPANLQYFAGHFPGNPVLPGIIQTHWAVHYARQYWGDLGEFAGLEAVKFQQLIVARQRLLLELDYAADKGKLYFSYRTEPNQAKARTFSSGRILFSNET